MYIVYGIHLFLIMRFHIGDRVLISLHAEQLFDPTHTNGQYYRQISNRGQ
jgi:hypothetical protein